MNKLSDVPRFTVSILLCLLILTTAVWLPAGAQDNGEDPRVFRVHYRTWEELNAVAGHLDVWEVHHTEGVFVAALTADEAAQLAAAGYEVEPANDLTPASRQVTAQSQSTGIPGYACYRTVEETDADLTTLAAAHPDLARWIDIGDSWDKITPGGAQGHDLHALVLTNYARTGPKFKFALMAAIHARELATTEAAVRFAESLVANYGVDPDVTWLLDYGEFHLLPLANPDGRKFAEELVYWRKNTNRTFDCSSPSHYGVDLNRNSSFKWNECEGSECSSSSACAQTYRGVSPASEPETQAIQTYLTSIFPDHRGPNDGDAAPLNSDGVFISLHSYGQLVLFPWGYSTMLAPNGMMLQTLGRKFGYHTGHVVCQAGAPGCLYMTDGTTDDWSYGELGVASYTFEIGKEFFESCSSFENTILPAVTPALLTAFKASRRPYQSPAGPDALNVAITPTQVIAGQPVTLTVKLDDTRFNANALHLGVEPTQNISGAIYTVGTPSWVSGTVTLTLSATDGSFDARVEDAHAVIDTTGWPPGRILVFAQGQDAAGNWGAAGAAFVTVSPQEARALKAVISPATNVARPGNSAAYLLTVVNQGVFSDTYTLQVTSTWPVSAPLSTGPLASLEKIVLPIDVTPPTTVTIGLTNTATIQIVSTMDQSISTSVSIATTSIAHTQYLPVVTR